MRCPGMDNRGGGVGRRRWLGRAVRLVVLGLAGSIGMWLGLVPYLDLSEGPFVGPDTQFERAGFSSSDCYWSPEAAAVDDRLGRVLLAVPLATVLLSASGTAFAAWRNRRSQFSPSMGHRSASAELFLASVGVGLLAAVVVGFAHGYNIGDLLDTGCVAAAVPSPGVMTVAASCAAFGAWTIGFWLEQRSEGRRRSLTNIESPARDEAKPA